MKKLKQLFQRFYTEGSPAHKKGDPALSKLSQIDKKDTFLRYTQTPSTKSPALSSLPQRLKPGQVSLGQLSHLEQLKRTVLKSLDAPSIKKALDELLDLKAYDTISLILRKKNADLSFYKYASKQALKAKDYSLALRLVKDITKPIVYKDTIEAIVYNQDYHALEPAIQSIEAYIRYYHRLNAVEANIYKQYAYAFAALAGVKDKAYNFAFSWAKQMGRCGYVWVDLVTLIAQNKDFWEIERFAESAAHLKDTAYAAALAYCEEESTWAEVFSKKCSKEALTL